MDRRLASWLAIGAGLALAVGGIGWSVAQAGSGLQPWDPELADNLIFAKSLPLIIGFGVLTGFARALAHSRRTEQRADGAIRRFHPATALNHWINALGFLLAMATGSIQYLKGVLDVSAPVPLFWIYRVHFVGASLMVYAAALFVTYRLMVGDHRLLPRRGQWIRHLRGLAHELPRPLGGFLAAGFGLDMRRPPPPADQFTYYEKVVSFPIWTVLLALILITGFLKAMRYLVPIPGEVLWWASALHVGAMVLLAAKFLDHLRYVLGPSRWPLLRSMVTTWIDEQYVRRWHPTWYQAIQVERGALGDARPEWSGAPTSARAVASTPQGGAE